MAPRAGENQSHLDSAGLVAVIGSRPWLLRTIKGHVLSADYYAYGLRFNEHLEEEDGPNHWKGQTQCGIRSPKGLIP
jgi:hypothetical protein